ncbi:MAG: glycosyltransferase family 9 protein [bacterium]|nr:glycosyltransferase family 9 protein [bacterium]
MRLRGNPWLKALDRHLLGALLGLGRRKQDHSAISEPPKSILLVKFNALGDTILFLALARILKQRWPDVRVDFLGSEINRPVLERCRDLDQILIMRLEKMVSNPWAFIRMVDRLRQRKYDVLIDGSQWERITALIAILSGAKKTIGFDTPGQKRATAFNYRLPHRRELHEIDCFLSLLEPLGIIANAGERFADYSVGEVDRRRLQQLTLPDGLRIVFHPGCGAHGWPRQWPIDNYIKLADLIWAEFPDANLILSGSTSEMGLCETIAAHVSRPVHNLCAQLDFLLLTALLEKTDLVVCGNTGVMHLAAALNTPVVALHGPTDPRRWGPLSSKAVVIQSSKSCVPCLYLGNEYDCECPDCMGYISVEEVFAACKEILSAAVSAMDENGRIKHDR